jgi:hypothetical protein
VAVRHILSYKNKKSVHLFPLLGLFGCCATFAFSPFLFHIKMTHNDRYETKNANQEHHCKWELCCATFTVEMELFTHSLQHWDDYLSSKKCKWTGCILPPSDYPPFTEHIISHFSAVLERQLDPTDFKYYSEGISRDLVRKRSWYDIIEEQTEGMTRYRFKHQICMALSPFLRMRLSIHSA